MKDNRGQGDLSVWKTLVGLLRSPDEDARAVRPFFWLATLVLVGLYVWSVASIPALRVPGHLLLFTVLMGVHIVLHWTTPGLASHRSALLPYFVLQSALALAINLLVGSPGIMLGLYLALAGEAVGVLRDLLLSSLAVIGFLALAAVTAGLGTGWSALPGALVAVGLMALFIMIYVTLFMREMEARRRAQTLLYDLESAHRQLEAYASQVQQLTLTQERQRMARDLHDTLAQGLAGMILQLEAADSHLANGHVDRAQAVVQQAMARARSTLGEARSVIGDLRALSTSPGDVHEIARAEADRFTASGGLPCELQAPEAVGVPAETAEQVQRFLSEALSNVARHARASRAWILVEADGDGLGVTVRDDGTGFELEEASGQPGHFGLVGMRERARLAGGRVEVLSGRGVGTSLKLWLPLGREASRA
jgi:NarL family two-component system sensor histidine kinase YdfH